MKLKYLSENKIASALIVSLTIGIVSYFVGLHNQSQKDEEKEVSKEVLETHPTILQLQSSLDKILANQQNFETGMQTLNEKVGLIQESQNNMSKKEDSRWDYVNNVLRSEVKTNAESFKKYVDREEYEYQNTLIWEHCCPQNDDPSPEKKGKTDENK